MSAGPVRRVLGGLLMALVGLGTVGCTGSDDSSSPAPTVAPTPTDEGTPLVDVDTRALVVRRAPFCDVVGSAAVARALGVDADRVPGVAAYENGQRTKLTSGVTDVAHEYGCTWKVGGSVARAWVFAPPVTEKRAEALAAGPRRVHGCSPTRGAAVYPAYGKPSVGLTCRLDGAIEVSWRGLFGDAWLTCTLTAPEVQQTDLADRAGRWCAAVAIAASAS